MVITSSPLALIPAIISFTVNTKATIKGNEIDKQYFERMSVKRRGREYFERELPEKKYAQDIRIYDAGNLILDEQKKLGEEIVTLAKQQTSNKLRIFLGSDIVNGICQGAMYLIIGIDVLLQKVTIGEFSSLIQTALEFNNSLNGISSGYGLLEYTCSLMVKYMKFIEIVEKYEWKNQEQLDLISDKIKDVTIEFRNVSFKYPNTDLYVLKNINTVIHNGEHISIVGENGAGKTTFVKLLCRLYDVTEGEILINGKNIQSVNIYDYMKLLSVVFQDYKLLAFSIKDNITLGESEENDKIMKLCELGGISDWVDSTDNKLDTILYKMFDKAGIEPSGGQAQKLAIVRALYKNAPVVILDEPTAALDPISEYEIYQHFDGLVGGKTAVYISHRLSSCRFCDRIIVFSDGTIAEDGTHQELVSKENGIYANMYHTQAKHYL
uniref:ABC transporter ATP-binding protein n=1 Tax=Acetatifactor sp. TaxID=1872090 RepID=UPI004055DABF